MSTKSLAGWAVNFWQKNFQKYMGVTKNHFTWGSKADKTSPETTESKERHTEQGMQTGDSKNLKSDVKAFPWESAI